MAPSDNVTSELAGLIFDTPAPTVKTSSLSPPAKQANNVQPTDLIGLTFDAPAPAIEMSSSSPPIDKADDEQPVGLSVSDVFLWERLHKLGAYNNGSVSPTESVKQEHLDLLYSTESADHAANLPVLQPAPKAKASSLLLRGGSTEKSVSIRAPSTIMAPGFEMPRIYDIPKANENFTQSKPQPQVGVPDWMNMTVSEAMRKQALTPSAAKAKGRGGEDSINGHQASTFATTTTNTTYTTSSMPTSKNFSQWRAQAERNPKQSTKAKGKVEEYTFW
ncbi:MAG: hypothetical protein LQ346_008868 [Caloplaca aetnensis]|nr:MAG: hypothetical protein LQ346_008868 [Caloplaca aetnensis]